jgi:dynein heavy chain
VFEWKQLFHALTFFHAIVRERRRFGPLGWSFQYDFNDSDFRISKSQILEMVRRFDTIPFAALRYLTGECNYGGRVTDDRDRRTLTTMLKDFYNEKVLKGDEDSPYYIIGE